MIEVKVRVGYLKKLGTKNKSILDRISYYTDEQRLNISLDKFTEKELEKLMAIAEENKKLRPFDSFGDARIIKKIKIFKKLGKIEGETKVRRLEYLTEAI